MPRKRFITKANSEPLSSLSALWKKNSTVIRSPVKTPVLKTLMASKTSNRMIEPSALNPKYYPLQWSVGFGRSSNRGQHTRLSFGAHHLREPSDMALWANYFLEPRKGEVRRIYLLRGWVNKRWFAFAVVVAGRKAGLGSRLSPPLSSRARRSSPLRRHPTPSAQTRSATWRPRRGSPRR